MNDLPKPSKAPCGTCPYRRDVPAGIWEAHEYEKLPPYDGETGEQLINGGTALFFCHQNDGHLCAGWVGCHDMNHAIAVRIAPVDPSVFDYVSPIPLFASGAEACAHGLSGVDDPSDAAIAAMEKLAAQRARKSDDLLECHCIPGHKSTHLTHACAVCGFTDADLEDGKPIPPCIPTTTTSAS